MKMNVTEGRGDLADLRQRIDEIDGAIHDLLMKRSALIERIGEVKGEDGIVMRPGREAQVLRRLLNRHRGPFPAGVLARIWREIISACTAMQQSLGVAVYEDEGSRLFERLGREHFGTSTKLTHFASVSGVMRAISDGQATVGLLPLPGQGRDAAWWRFLARPSKDTPRVIARLPFIQFPDRKLDEPEALVVGLVPHEPSGDDHSFLIVETREAVSRGVLASMLERSGLDRPERGLFEDTDEQRLHFVEVTGFVGDMDARLSRLMDEGGGLLTHIRVAGAFALPIREKTAGGEKDA